MHECDPSVTKYFTDANLIGRSRETKIKDSGFIGPFQMQNNPEFPGIILGVRGRAGVRGGRILL